jgi:hypothetical protein
MTRALRRPNPSVSLPEKILTSEVVASAVPSIRPTERTLTPRTVTRNAGNNPQVEYWLSGQVNERFRPQLQGQLYISQRSWVDIVCWHDVLPKVVLRVEPDDGFIKALDRELQIFNFFVERVMEKIHATSEAAVPQGKLALRAALRASVEIVP